MHYVIGTTNIELKKNIPASSCSLSTLSYRSTIIGNSTLEKHCLKNTKIEFSTFFMLDFVYFSVGISPLPKIVFF